MRTGILLLLFLLTINLAATPVGATGRVGRPNVVVLFADDLGWGDLSTYGHPLIRTPNLDRLAADGLRFTSFYAAPACTPARAQLMTGRYATEVGLPGVLLAENPAGLAADAVTVPKLLKGAGYRTHMIGKWHLGHTQEHHWPTSQGFDHWFGLPYSHDIQKPWVQTDVPLRMYRDREAIEENPDYTTLTPRYTEAAVEFLNRAAGDEQPFFLYVAYNMPHLPLGAPERFRGKSAGGFYGDVIEMIDWSVGEIRTALEANGLAEDTIILFTSDNGPWAELPDRMIAGGVERWDHGSAGPFRGSKGSTWEGGVRVPAIACWPGTIPAGRVTPQIASVLDVMPTVAALAGGEVAADVKIDGIDLSPLLLGAAESLDRPPLFHFAGRQLQAVRVGDWKLRQAQGGAAELFHLGRDPAERYDVSADEPAKAAELQAVMDAYRQDLRE